MISFANRFIVVSSVVGGVVFLIAACAAENVEASSFNRSCTKNDDCVAVIEIVSDAGNCSQPCSAINKRDQDRYQTEFEKEAHDCKTKTPPECSNATARCDNGTCVVVP